MLPSDGITAGIFGEFLEAKIFPAMSPEVTWNFWVLFHKKKNRAR